MNGIHDLGGMHGMGPIVREENEPVFHEPWEGRVYAITRAIGAFGKWNLDASRHAIEMLPPADYLRMSYYEKWLARNIGLLIRHGIITREEIETGKAATEAAPALRRLSAAEAAAHANRRDRYSRPDAAAVARFVVGDRVRARNMNPEGHTRLPRYARGKQGVISRHHGIFVFPDTNAHFQGEQPQHLYSVRFAARELWGDEASPRDCVHLDLWDPYLDHA
ncbi:MAG: nitrile hydratase subunit beta [Bryobacterales bacterium]|nr:nitrile hydratase subunit beta [Bryobacterales bacterium]MBV9400534.1 nitrile hydratase subunit beta [Bryobacterales bacterium]